ncbi:MAG TPA: hypothetical protein VI670_21230, partial [Thermoanaerobaculia bacterium]
AKSLPGATDRARESFKITVFDRKLLARRTLQVELPEFLICALEARLEEANEDATAEDRFSIDHLIESEIVNLISLRDVAELEMVAPGFTNAVRQRLVEVRE